MAKKKRKTRARSGKRDLSPSTKRTIGGIMQIAAGLLLFFALQDEAGILGERVSNVMTMLFGSWSMLFTIFLVGVGLFHTFAPGSKIEMKRTTGLVVCLLSFLGLMTISGDVVAMGQQNREMGGAIGFMVAFPLVHFTGTAGAYVILISGGLIGLFLSFEPDVGALVERVKMLLASKPQGPVLAKTGRVAMKEPPVVEDEGDDDEDEEETADDLIEDDNEAPELNIVRPPSLAQMAAKAKTEQMMRSKLRAIAGDVLEMKDTRFEEWTFPSMELLDAIHTEFAVNDEELKKNAKLIEEKLEEFGIDVTVRDARPGPTVTQFTLQPAEGVKLSKIENLKNDLALALAAQSLRIEAPIPGKSLVGIEMPNLDRTTVHLREILESSVFGESESTLTLPLGRDVSGDVVIASIEDMPHLLIAGATGSGKSVCMNVLLTSLLYQNAPHELKFILIDPKRVELMPYNGIPHLLTPVITEAEKALQALRWAVAEMGRRLHRFSEQGARNLAEYNEKQTDEGQKMPRIIIVIDELADLMMRQFRRDTETMIVRIAQMARAVGMHLVIATQRPSVDVITGLIKANIPTRIAFRVVSSVDSRTILDGIGAEDLLGKGDMLYMTAATPKPVRIQGIYVGGKEIERVINAVKIAGGGKVTEQIGLSQDDESTSGDETDIGISGKPATPMIDLEADDNGGDDLFFDAVRVVQASGKASASLLQRQLKVGYARAARLLDIMEEKGIVGPADGAKPRKVYIEQMAGSPAEV